MVCEKVQRGVIKTAHIRTKEQPANLCTKPVSAAQFKALLGKLSVINIHSNLRGSLEEGDTVVSVKEGIRTSQ